MSAHEVELLGGPCDGERRVVPDRDKILVMAAPRSLRPEFMNAESGIPLAEVPIVEYAYVRDEENPALLRYVGERQR